MAFLARVMRKCPELPGTGNPPLRQGLWSDLIVRGFILHGIPRPGRIRCSPLVAHVPHSLSQQDMACVVKQTGEQWEAQGGIQAETESFRTENLFFLSWHAFK